MMFDFLNVGVERDMESFKEFFESFFFRVDGFKIYFIFVICGIGFYEFWKIGRYFFYYLFIFLVIFIVVKGSLLWG